MSNANKSPKIPYCGYSQESAQMIRNPYPEPDHHPVLPIGRPNHNIKFQLLLQ